MPSYCVLEISLNWTGLVAQLFIQIVIICTVVAGTWISIAYLARYITTLTCVIIRNRLKVSIWTILITFVGQKKRWNSCVANTAIIWIPLTDQTVCIAFIAIYAVLEIGVRTHYIAFVIQEQKWTYAGQTFIYIVFTSCAWTITSVTSSIRIVLHIAVWTVDNTLTGTVTRKNISNKFRNVVDFALWAIVS